MMKFFMAVSLALMFGFFGSTTKSKEPKGPLPSPSEPFGEMMDAGPMPKHCPPFVCGD